MRELGIISDIEDTCIVNAFMGCFHLAHHPIRIAGEKAPELSGPSKGAIFSGLTCLGQTVSFYYSYAGGSILDWIYSLCLKI